MVKETFRTIAELASQTMEDVLNEKIGTEEVDAVCKKINDFKKKMLEDVKNYKEMTNPTLCTTSRVSLWCVGMRWSGTELLRSHRDNNLRGRRSIPQWAMRSYMIVFPPPSLHKWFRLRSPPNIFFDKSCSDWSFVIFEEIMKKVSQLTKCTVICIFLRFLQTYPLLKRFDWTFIFHIQKDRCLIHQTLKNSISWKGNQIFWTYILACFWL